MKILILAMLLAVVQALQPSPMQKENAAKAANHKQQTNTPQSSPAPTVSAKEVKEPVVHPQQSPAHKEYPVAQEHNFNYMVLGFWINFALVAATLIIAVFAVIQARAAKKSADTAECSAMFAQSALKSSERADVLLDATRIDWEPGKALFDSRMTFVFKNFGRTRAKNVSIGIRIFVEGLTFLDPPCLQPALLVMGVGQQEVVSCRTFRELLADKDFQNIIAGKTALRFEAGLTYQDVFNSTYITRYMIRFEHKMMTFKIEECNAG